ncbi:Plasmodium vivax Vir protein, putative [Plasmodium vivax]|uniref:Vir protein, putative n=1 Tax=Plasmodium vivax TaxID=5855 RepID=A0A1G4E2D0_PLAVI|nr:Plasmodium vivax Vir protein, putative [Plasmodium vivax]
MAGKNNIYNLNNFLEGNDKLRLSYLNTFYQSYFNISCEDRTYSNYYCSPDTNFETLPSHLWQIYRKFERNLKIIRDDREIYDFFGETYKKKLCFYLKYWIYDRLISEQITDDHFSKFFKLWNDRKITKCSNCDCEFKIKSFSEVKQLKKTYDYSLFLREYKRNSKINKHVSNKNYCTYISEAKAMYSLLQESCKNDSNEYCNEFNEYVLPYINGEVSGTYEDEDTEVEEGAEVEEDTDEGEDLSSFLCNTELAYVPEPEEQQEAEELLKKLAERKAKEQRDRAQLEKAEEDDAPRVQSQQEAVLPHRLGDRASGHVLPETPPVPDSFMISTGLNTGSDGNGSSMKTITSASLVGVPSIIFLLYKFSPVRTWLDPRIRKTKSDLRNSIQGSNELQSHDYNFHTTNMDFSRINVGYQSR